MCGSIIFAAILILFMNIGVLSPADAHVTFNAGGFGDIRVGDFNTTIDGEGATRIYLGGTTGGGLAGSLYHSGSTNTYEVWTNESPATEWVGPTGPNHAGSSAGSVLSSAAYIGLHTPTQVRLLETGVYGSTATTCAGWARQRDRALVTVPPDGLTFSRRSESPFELTTHS